MQRAWASNNTIALLYEKPTSNGSIAPSHNDEIRPCVSAGKLPERRDAPASHRGGPCATPGLARLQVPDPIKREKNKYQTPTHNTRHTQTHWGARRTISVAERGRAGGGKGRVRAGFTFAECPLEATWYYICACERCVSFVASLGLEQELQKPHEHRLFFRAESVP